MTSVRRSLVVTPADGVVVPIGVLVTSRKGSSNGFRLSGVIVVTRDRFSMSVVMLNGSTFRSGFDVSIAGLGSSASLRS